MIRKPKNYRIGNMVYFVYNSLPHTGIIKYIEPETFTVEDVTFLNPFDKDALQVSKWDCTKTGEIWLPKYPDNEFGRMIKSYDKTRYSYEGMQKRRIIGETLFSPKIIFEPDEMFFLLDDDKWYRYETVSFTDNHEKVAALVGDDESIIPDWIYQPNYRLINGFKNSNRREVNEHNVIAILQKDREFKKIEHEAYHCDDKEKAEKLIASLKFHMDIIYRVDQDGILGTDRGYEVPFKHEYGKFRDVRVR